VILSSKTDGFERQLAARIQQEREARGWTLADLAEHSGVSRAMLSKVEREEASPTAVLLGHISAAFGLTLSQLFARVEGPSGQIVKRAEQATWRDPLTGFTRSALSPAGAVPLGLVWCALPPGTEVRYPATAFLPIEDQQIVMIEGQLIVEQERNTLILDTGDCMRFGTPEATTFANKGKRFARYIVATLQKR
jgi:transcriptional regulator with XRE-family HTH domain